MDLVQTVTDVFSDGEILTIAGLEKTALLAATDVQLMLFTNVPAITRATKLGDLTEANFGGYARATISAWNGPYLDSVGFGYIMSAVEIFTADGTSSNAVTGSALIRDNGGTQATATAAIGGGGAIASTVITLAGTKYEAPPAVTITGAPGVGFVGHTTLSADGVASIVIDNPGSGYVAPVVHIAKPQSIVLSGLFPSPVVMALVTDALPTVVEVAIPPITNS